jgi:hypothetical protein
MQIPKHHVVGLLALLLIGASPPSQGVGGKSGGMPTLSTLRYLSAQKATDRKNDALDRSSQSSDNLVGEARLAKNRRYNTGGKDLTLIDPKLGPDEEADRFVDHYWLSDVPLFPVSESAVIVIGTLMGAHPYLSEDRSSIYTEVTLRIEEALKSDRTIKRTLTLDLMGGAIRLESGREVRLDEPNRGPGELEVGLRYVVFAKRTHDDSDLEMITGFELRAGKVFGLTSDGGVSFTSRRGVPEELTEEAPLLAAVRQAVRKARH